MAKLSFSAQIGAWAEKVKDAPEVIFKESVQEISEIMHTPTSQGGRMRVDTGFLWSSSLASTTAMPTIDRNARPVKGQTYVPDFGQIEAVIASADTSDTIYIGFTAVYAAAREFGARGQPADAFVRSAAQLWQSTVEAKAREYRSRLGL